MARKAKIDTDTLIGLIDQFYAEKCDGDVSQLKVPLIGEYVRSKGYDVANYLIRRNEEGMEYIKKLQGSTEEVHIHTVAVYRDMDLDAFFAKNNTKDKLKEALKERESYYREVTRSAAYSFKENKQLNTQVKHLQERIAKLEAELEAAKQSNSDGLSDCRNYQAENRKLRNIIDTYVYPEIANELLKKDGLIHETAGIVNPDKISKEIVAADTDINEIKNNVIKGLFESI